MDNITQSVSQEFPDLTFCEIIQVDNLEKIDKSFSPINTIPGMANWVKWIQKHHTEINWLRAQLEEQKNLVLKRTSPSSFIAILAEKNDIPMLAGLLDSFDQQEIEKDFGPIDSGAPSDSNFSEALRMQTAIMPNHDEILKDLKKFFVVRQQQDIVGGDLYWHKNVEGLPLLVLLDCSSKGVEGAMNSVVCHSLLNQAIAEVGAGEVSKFVTRFYKLLISYNLKTTDILDHKILVQLGAYLFDFSKKEIRYVTTGIASYLKIGSSLELIQTEMEVNYTKLNSELLAEKTIPMKGVEAIYLFTDGLVDRQDSSDTHEVEYKAIGEMILKEKTFGKDHYVQEISKWKASNVQNDDITLIGVAI